MRIGQSALMLRFEHGDQNLSEEHRQVEGVYLKLAFRCPFKRDARPVQWTHCISMVIDTSVGDRVKQGLNVGGLDTRWGLEAENNTSTTLSGSSGFWMQQPRES